LDTVLQIVERGELIDPSGGTVDFRETLVIMTSSLGNEGSDTLTPAFRPELLRHIDETIVFKYLDRDQLRQVVEITRNRTGRVLSVHPTGGRLVSAVPAVRTP
ncbi:MAG TPA: AAA family ATPase, partial [Chloroflexota bacterium]|nr:AAA family ATPase [Chloroflexota bacterium]